MDILGIRHTADGDSKDVFIDVSSTTYKLRKSYLRRERQRNVHVVRMYGHYRIFPLRYAFYRRGHLRCLSHGGRAMRRPVSCGVSE